MIKELAQSASLESLHRDIMLMSFQQSTESIAVDKFVALFSKVKEKIGFSSDYSDMYNYSVNLKRIDKLYRKLDSVKYSELSDVLIYKPVGLTGTYPELVTFLIESDMVIAQLAQIKLPNMIKQLQARIANPKTLASESLHDMTGIRDLTREKTKIRSMGSSLFDNSKVSDQVKFNVLFNNVTEFRGSIKGVDALAYNLMGKDGHINRIIDARGELTDMISKLEERMAAEPHIYQLSLGVGKRFSDDLFKIAEDLEFFGAYLQLMGIVITSLNKNIDLLGKIL